jgi:hypothetical protein
VHGVIILPPEGMWSPDSPPAYDDEPVYRSHHLSVVDDDDDQPLFLSTVAYDDDQPVFRSVSA